MAKIVAVDSVVKEYLDVYSLDVQGMENLALRGSKKLLEDYGVGMIWIELLGGKYFVKRSVEILTLLDERYVMFDFVVWGKFLGKENDPAAKAERKNFYIDRKESRLFGDYIENYRRVSDDEYAWAGNDIIAVRRDLATPEVLERLANLARNICKADGPSARCEFRNIMRSIGENF